MIDHHAALIYTMVLVSAADSDMTDAEMATIGEVVRYLPIFRNFDHDSLPRIAQECAAILDDDDGLEKALDAITSALPDKLRETAYAVACDVVAADESASQEELRLLEILRHHLGISRLAGAAIERGARARHAVA